MYIPIENVQHGDVIVEGRDRVKVTKIEVGRCSSKGTHVNSKVCYERGMVVEVLRDSGKDEMVEWDIDNNVPVSALV